MSKSYILLAVLCLASVVLAEQCNNTHLEFFSQYSLGKLDELNRTFTAMEPKININNVTWKRNDTATYTISGIKPTFFYRDSKQYAEILGNDTVVITGGDLFVRFDFNWEKTGTVKISGNGSAIGDSDEIQFYYTLVIKDGFLIKQLQETGNVTFSHFGINISRVSPPEATDDDRTSLKNLFNDIMNVTTVRHELQEEIDKYFHYYLGQTLNNEKRKIDQHFSYQWKGDKGNLVVEYTLLPTSVDVEPQGLTLFYLASIKNYTNWTCENHGPNLPLNPKVFGGIQEFITFDVYKNTLKYAIDQGFMDVDLKRAGWQSRFFQFYAGDLYEVIPRVATIYPANNIVTGLCQTSSKSANVGKANLNHHAINATLTYQCQLSIVNQKVTEFEVTVSIIAQGRPNATHLDFVVTEFKHETKLIPYLEFKIQNQQLARHMITHSLNRLLGHKVLGSGWEVFPRDYPHFIVEQNYTCLYDSTHVESGQPDAQSLEL